MRRALTITVSCLVAGCGILGISDDERQTWEVAPYKGSCVGLSPRTCLQIRPLGETEFRNTFGTPAGYTFEWGIRTVIEVEIREVENPPADGSATEVLLRRVLDRSPAEPGLQFSLRVPTDIGLEEVDAHVWRVFHEDPVLICAASVDCEAFRAAVSEHSALELSITMPVAPADTLVLAAWTVCSEPFGPCASG